MRKRVDITELEIGMFVAELDRPWLDSPFLFQGFLIENQEELGKIQELCDHVFIDVERSATEHGGKGRAAKVAHTMLAEGRRDQAEEFRDAYQTVRIAHQNVQLGIIKILDDRRLGGMIQTAPVRDAVGNLIQSVLQNPSAALWLTRLHVSDEYTQAHSLNVAILASAFARHRDLPTTDIEAIGLGAVLHDIGLSEYASEILRKKASLTEEEFATVRKHPVDGLSCLDDPDKLPQISREIIRWHHERINGKGYPDGLRGKQIPEHVRIVGIADTYDAMVSDRSYRRGLLPSDALQEMLRESEATFGRSLVESFIRSIGIYPSGSIVRLNTGAIAAVAASNPEARLSPLALMLKTAEGEEITPPRLVDLAHTEEKIGERWFITEIVDPSEHGIDMKALAANELQGAM